jgi:cytochrome c peroxidase
MNQFGGVNHDLAQGNGILTSMVGANDLGSVIGSGTGLDLTNTHPISFVYNSALAALDPGVKDPNVATTSLGGTIAQDLLDANGKVQCASCHEVHDQTIYRFGKISNAGSALCLTCHNK